MNEELKIIIKAISDEAEKNLAEVKKEIAGIKNESQKASKTVDTSMKSIAKGIGVAITAAMALTAAMVSLGKSAQEIEKGFSKLNTTFNSLGSSSKQASNTYKELFGFLGDHDVAIETAQSLALITTEEKALAEWAHILQGAFATMGDKLPIEGLAEAANETIKTGVATGVLVDALTWMGVSEDAFNNSLAQTVSLEEREALIRGTLNSLYSNAATAYEQANQTTIKYNQSQANLNLALSQAAQYLTPLLISINNLGTVLLTNFAPALETVSIYLTGFIQLLAECIAWVGSFFGIVSSSTSDTTADIAAYEAEMRNYTNALYDSFNASNDEIDNTQDKLEKLKKQTMGFDELNIVGSGTDTSKDNSSGGGGGGAISNLPKMPNPADFGIGGGSDLFSLSDFQKQVDEAKEKIQGLLVIVGLVAAGVAAWKILDFIDQIRSAQQAIDIMNTTKVRLPNGNWDTFVPTAAQIKRGKEGQKYLDDLKLRIANIGTSIMFIGGATVAVLGFIDAWSSAEGVDWVNLAAMIGGVALVIGALKLKFEDPWITAIGAAVAAIALLIIGVKDFIEQGPTLQNTIILIGAAVAAAVAAATMGVGPLVAAVIGAVTAIAGFIAGIVFEEEAILSAEEAQLAYTEAKEAAAAAENDYISAIDAAESALNRLKTAEEKAGMSGAELYKQVQSGALDYKNMTAEQKELYKAYLDNEKKQKDLEESTKALEEAKKKETIASFENQLSLAKESGDYDSYKKAVVDAFENGTLSAEEARDLIEKSMSEMSDASQQTFMEDLPGDIKEGMNPGKYETTRKKLGEWFGNAWKGIQNTFSNVGSFFSNKFEEAGRNIKNAFSSIGTFFSNLWNDITRIFSEVGSTIANAVSNAFSTAINWVLETAIGIINGFISAINFAISIINAIPGVSINKLDMLEVPKLATGGVVNSATVAMIGENGKEAVLPLENNTDWMDKLADRIASRNNTPSKIVLTLDGRELGWANINSINSITRQTGSLQLTLA